MNRISIVSECVQQTDALYNLVQQKQPLSTSSDSTNKIWNCCRVADLREKVSDIHRHVSCHEQMTGRPFEQIVSRDEYGISVTSEDINYIKNTLLSVRLYVNNCIYALASSDFLMANRRKPEIVMDQINSSVNLAKIARARMGKSGLFLEVVHEATTRFYGNVSQLLAVFQDEKSIPTDKLLKKNVERFCQLLNIASELHNNGNSVAPQLAHVEEANGNEGCSKTELSSAIPMAAKQLVEGLDKWDSKQENHKELRKLQALWTGWHIDRKILPINQEDFGDKIKLGQGATSVVYAGRLVTNGWWELPVAVKAKPMGKEQVSSVLCEAFLHLMVQHYGIATFYGMWLPSIPARQVFIVVEKMERTLEEALLTGGGGEIDRVAILRDVAAALAHLHDLGIVHRNVKPATILLNSNNTQANLSGFSTSYHRSTNTPANAATHLPHTLFYMHPDERANPSCKTTTKVDIWAFGLVACEDMTGEGRSKFLDKHHASLHEAASTLAEGISHTQARFVAVACLKNRAEERASMKDIYLHLEEIVGLGNTCDENTPAMSQTVRAQGWHEGASLGTRKRAGSEIHSGDQRRARTLADTHCVAEGNPCWRYIAEISVRELDSLTARLTVANKTEVALEFCRVKIDGQLTRFMFVNPCSTLQVTKKGKQAFFVLRDKDTHTFRAAIVARGKNRKLTVGRDYLITDYETNRSSIYRSKYDMLINSQIDCTVTNRANNGRPSWPLRPVTSSEEVPLSLEHDGGLPVLRVDCGGDEVPFIDNLSGSPKWTGKTTRGSALVIRTTSRNRGFVCAVGVPPTSVKFDVGLHSL